MASYADDFNRASLGSNWTAVNAGSWAISGSTVLAQTNTTGTYRGLRWNGGAFDSNDFYARVTVRAAAGYGFGILVRCPTTGTAATDIDGYAIVGFVGDQWYRIEFTDGSDAGYIGLGGTVTANTDYTIEVRAVGSTITVYLNGAQQAQWTDTTYTTGGAMLVTYGAATFDNFEAADIVSGIVGNAALTQAAQTIAAACAVDAGGGNAASAMAQAAQAVSAAAQIVVAGTATMAQAAQATANPAALRFYGNATGDIDRVRIPLEDGSQQYPVNVGAGSFSVEFWLRTAYADNTTAATDVRYSNIIYDRDSWGEQRGHCIGVTRDGANLVPIFGQAGAGGSWVGLRASTNVGDNAWHHVAVTRDAATGQVRIWVDGTLSATGTYDTSDWSYPAGHTVSSGQDNNRLILGTEKHDVGFGFNGQMRNLRICPIVRYNAEFTPDWRTGADANTAALYQFEDATGTVLRDSLVAAQNGALLVGGSPSGPIWVALAAASVTGATGVNAAAAMTQAAQGISSAAAAQIAAALARTQEAHGAAAGVAVVVSAMAQPVQAAQGAGAAAAVAIRAIGVMTQAASELSAAGAVGASPITAVLASAQGPQGTIAQTAVGVAAVAGIVTAAHGVTAAATVAVTAATGTEQAANMVDAAAAVGNPPMLANVAITQAAHGVTAAGAVAVSATTAATQSPQDVAGTLSGTVTAAAVLTQHSASVAATASVFDIVAASVETAQTANGIIAVIVVGIVSISAARVVPIIADNRTISARAEDRTIPAR